MRVRLAALILVLVLASCAGEPARRFPVRHLILISLDTARADHFGFMGNEIVQTPNLDALADRSMVFTDYMTVVPTTLASHVSLFTGRYPHNHGAARNGFMVHPDNVMLPEILKSAGYSTAGFAACFALADRFGFGQGFDHYDEDFDMLKGTSAAGQDQRVAQSVTDAVLDYIEGGEIPEHLFLFVHYFDPHQPYCAPPPYDTIYDRDGSQGFTAADFVKTHRGESSPRVRRQVRRFGMQYAAEFTYMDHHLGRLLDYLGERGILDEALVVITSDHGESLWEHGEEFNHGFKVFQSTMHCACMFALPGGDLGGTRSGRPISSIDVLPTILELLAIDIPGDVDGQAVDLDRLDEPYGQPARFGQASKPWEEIETDPSWTNMTKARCIRRGDYKFIQTPFLGTEELYDVKEDPAEILNLLDDPSEGRDTAADSLRRELEAWAVSGNPLPSRFEPVHTEETRRRLKSLGYLQ